MVVMRAGIGLLLGLTAVHVAAAELVYDSLTNPQNPTWWEFAGGSHLDTLGDEIFLGGTGRQITKIDLVTTSPFPVEPATIAIFKNDGSGGAPGTMLWQSDLLFFDGDIEQVLVPNVSVPERITIAVRNHRLTQVGEGQYWRADGPPIVGTSPNHVWRADNYGSWVLDQSAGANDLAMRVTAVPEPMTLAVLGIGLLACMRCRRRAQDSV